MATMRSPIMGLSLSGVCNQIADINQVLIWVRFDCCWDTQFRNVNVYLSATNTVPSGTAIATGLTGASSGQAFTLSATNVTIAVKFLTLYSVKAAADALTVNEVYVTRIGEPSAMHAGLLWCTSGARYYCVQSASHCSACGWHGKCTHLVNARVHAAATKACPACRADTIITAGTFSPSAFSASNDWTKLNDGYMYNLPGPGGASTSASSGGALPYIQVCACIVPM